MNIAWSPLALECVEVGSQHIREMIFGAYRVVYCVKKQVNTLTVRCSTQLLREYEPGNSDTDTSST